MKSPGSEGNWRALLAAATPAGPTLSDKFKAWLLRRALRKKAPDMLKYLDFISGYKTIIGATGVLLTTIGEALSSYAGSPDIAHLFASARLAFTAFMTYGLALKAGKSQS